MATIRRLLEREGEGGGGYWELRIQKKKISKREPDGSS